MSESVLNIRLIRTPESKKEDDVIRITKLDEGFQLTFRYGFSNYIKPTLRTIECDAPTILQWLRITIDMLQHDDDPFASFQLDAQMLPSVLIMVSRLGRAYDIIIDAVEFQLNNWPEDPMPALVPMQLYADSPPFQPQQPQQPEQLQQPEQPEQPQPLQHPSPLHDKKTENEEYENLIRECTRYECTDTRCECTDTDCKYQCTDTRLEEQEKEDEEFTNYLAKLPEQSLASPTETPA
uniref:Uncharacterized protein n=1 Tax=viral metagenome TaxID=1070528 RepID=A0A6C0E6K0_9ZZZZ